MLAYYWCTFKTATASVELTPFTRWMGWRRGELTPLLLLLFSWSFCQAGFTGQQPVRLHCDNCIFVMGKKKYKLNFIKKKKSQNQKSIVFRYGKTCKQGLGFSFISCLWRWGSAFNGFLDFSQVALLCVVPLSLVSETLKIQKYDGLLLLSAVKFGRSNKLVYNKKTTDKILLVSEILFLRKKNKRQQF